MIAKLFNSLEEANLYLAEQKIRAEKGFLTKSERTQLKVLLEKPNLIVRKEPLSKGKPIITDIVALKKPCEPVKIGEDIKTILKDLKDTLVTHPNGIGLSANQIGYQKRVSFIRIPKQVGQKVEWKEFYLINAKIIQHIGKPIQIKNEGCLSFPGIKVSTDRYIHVVVNYLDENFKANTAAFSDIESFVVQHENDHTLGLTIFDRKHRSL